MLGFKGGVESRWGERECVAEMILPPDHLDPGPEANHGGGSLVVVAIPFGASKLCTAESFRMLISISGRPSDSLQCR